MDISYTKTNYTSYNKSNSLREQLQMQTIQPKKYLKWINELYSGHMLLILINYKVIRPTLTY